MKAHYYKDDQMLYRIEGDIATSISTHPFLQSIQISDGNTIYNDDISEFEEISEEEFHTAACNIMRILNEKINQ